MRAIALLAKQKLHLSHPVIVRVKELGLGAAAVGSIPALVNFFFFSSLLSFKRASQKLCLVAKIRPTYREDSAQNHRVPTAAETAEHRTSLQMGMTHSTLATSPCTSISRTFSRIDVPASGRRPLQMARSRSKEQHDCDKDP